ncbi:MAG: radical SAM protein [Acidobacteriota bacterium]|nr:radical SAM protein [Acidobacteriota bacterium]
MRGGKRRYQKFRAAPYYGGIATADAVGCSFLCAYCWNYGRNENPARFGTFLSADEAAHHLLEIARRRSFRLFRVTGSEPILGEASFEHLLRVIEIVLGDDPRASFILETNGLMLGHKEELSQRLRLPRLSVRVAIKGVDEPSFERISGARGEFWRYAFLALVNLEENGVRSWPALMGTLFSGSERDRLRHILRTYSISSGLELESLESYPFVLENMKRRGVLVP